MLRLKQAVLIFIVLAAGFVVGSWIGVERRAQMFSEAVQRRLSQTPAIALPVSEPLQRSFATDEDMISAVMSALKEEDPLFRAHRLHTLLGGLSSSELAALFDRVLKIDDREQRELILRPVIARWEALDPTAAEGAMKPFRDRLQSGKRIVWGSKDYVVFDAWARVRPDLALAMAATAPDSNWSKTMARTALEASTGGDPAKQLEILRGMPANALRGTLCAQAVRELGKKDSAAAEAQLDLLTDVRHRASAQRDIISSLAERDPAAALARVSEIASEMGSGVEGIQLVSAVFSKAASRDPRAALAAAENLPEELRLAASGSALVGWIEKSPKEALEWARENDVNLAEARASLTISQYGGSWRGAMLVAFEKDREFTLSWLREQPPSRERDAMLADGIYGGTLEQRLAIYAELTPEGRIKTIGQVIAAGRKGIDAGAAETFVQTLPQGAERVAAVESLVTLQLGTDSGRIDELINRYSPGPERDAATCGAITTLLGTNQPRALELAAQISDPTRREYQYVNIARTWISRDRPAALAWISETQVLSPDVKRVMLRQAEQR